MFQRENLSMSVSDTGINVTRYVDNKSLINVTNLSEQEGKNYLINIYSQGTLQSTPKFCRSFDHIHSVLRSIQ